MAGSGTSDDPWQLTTAPGSSRYTMYRDESADPPVLGLPGRLDHAEVPPAGRRGPPRLAAGTGRLGSAGGGRRGQGRPGRQRRSMGRDPANPVGGWYGLRKGYRGRFGMYLPPLLEALGLVELTHDKRNNTVRAL